MVITGVSGSGKSSLAFDTLYAEGYRKYIDSLSTKARMVLEQIGVDESSRDDLLTEFRAHYHGQIHQGREAERNRP